MTPRLASILLCGVSLISVAGCDSTPAPTSAPVTEPAAGNTPPASKALAAPGTPPTSASAP